jgi:hypothetical protein
LDKYPLKSKLNLDDVIPHGSGKKDKKSELDMIPETKDQTADKTGPSHLS